MHSALASGLSSHLLSTWGRKTLGTQKAGPSFPLQARAKFSLRVKQEGCSPG